MAAGHLAAAAALGLPDGWRADEYAARWLIVHCPVIGGVTLDMEQRCARAGYTNTSGKAISAKKYTGRGWVAKLHGDAVSWLQRVAEARR